MIDTKYTPILGLKTRYFESEGGEGAPLLLLHGWGSSINSWEKVIDELSSKGTKVIMADLPGFGETQEPSEPWRVDDYINFLQNFIKKFGVREFILAGHSFGGQIAISWAAKQDPNIKALVLMDAARVVRHKKIKAEIFRFITKTGNLPFQIPILKSLRPLVQKIWYKLAGEKDYYRSSKLMRQTMELVIAEEVGGRLEKIQIPTLILWGEHDLATPLSDGKIINERVKGSKLVAFESAGHPINLERPGEVAFRISEFLRQSNI